MKTIYQVRTRDGITYNVEASSHREAKLRASSPLIARHIAIMIQQAMSHIEYIEPFRGPSHLIKSPVFDDEFFNN